MSTAIMEAQLRDAINGDRDLMRRACIGVAQQPTGIAVDRRGRVLGLWHWRNGGFEFWDDGAASPRVKVDTVAEAVRFTREHTCPP